MGGFKIPISALLSEKNKHILSFQTDFCAFVGVRVEVKIKVTESISCSFLRLSAGRNTFTNAFSEKKSIRADGLDPIIIPVH